MFLFIPFSLILNCFVIYFFKKWLGPVGIFFISLYNSLFLIFLIIWQLFILLKFNCFFFLDIGQWFFIFDILDSNIIFIFDILSLLSTFLIIFLSIFAQFFGLEYMYREAYISRLLYLLNLFSTSVVFLFFIFDFFFILIVWELIGLFSLLLVNFYSNRIFTIKASLKTFILSRFSDMFIFMVFNFIIYFFNTTDFSFLFLQIPFFYFYNIYFFNIGFNILNLISLFIWLSGSIKGAQFLFHTWLPDAMEAPTPASALIHSSTLVIMGIYLILRFNLIFEFSIITNFIMAFWGSLTLSFASVSAFIQNDIKKLVAFSTISQMGYLFCGLGFNCFLEVFFYLIIHALNKAFLFILVGYIVHFFNSNTDFRFMSSLFNYSFDLFILFFFISLNLTGLPFTTGFIAKEFLLFQTFKDSFCTFLIRSCWFISFFFTPLYLITLVFNIFFSFKLSYFYSYFSYNYYFYKYIIKLNYAFYFYLNWFLIFSKITIFFYFILFLFILYFGEMLILILLNVLSTNFLFYINSYFTINTFIFFTNYFFNTSLLFLFNNFIWFFVFFIFKFFLIKL